MIKKVKIGGHYVSVVQIRKCGKKENYIAQARHNQEQIVIARQNKWGDPIHPQQKDECLLHEIIHHVTRVYNCRCSEATISRLSQGLFQVLRDNRLPFVKK